MRHVFAYFAFVTCLFPGKLFAQPLDAFVGKAHGATATIFGLGELSCGTVNRPRRCLKGLRTAAGELFDPDTPQVALSLPLGFSLKPRDIWLKLKNGKCTRLRLTDKKSQKMWRKPWDMTPGAVRALGDKPTHYWSAPVFLCLPNFDVALNPAF